MVVFKIEKCLKYNEYELKAGDKKIRLVLELFGIEKPKVGDVIVLHEKLLDENSSTFTKVCCFECLDILIKDKTELNEEIALYQTGNKKYVLRRVYG